MPAIVEQTEREMETATADPSPPTRGKDGGLVRLWKVNGETVEFSLAPFPPDDRPVYWFTGMGAQMWWRSQTINSFGVQPVIQKEAFVDGSFAPRNPWEEHMTREFLRSQNVDPDKSRDQRHPEGPGHFWRCGECMFRCPSFHVMDAHMRKLSHKGLLSE